MHNHLVAKYLTPELIAKYMRSHEFAGGSSSTEARSYLLRTKRLVRLGDKRLDDDTLTRVSLALSNAANRAFGYYGLLYDDSTAHKNLLRAAAEEYRKNWSEELASMPKDDVDKAVGSPADVSDKASGRHMSLPDIAKFVAEARRSFIQDKNDSATKCDCSCDEEDSDECDKEIVETLVGDFDLDKDDEEEAYYDPMGEESHGAEFGPLVQTGTHYTATQFASGLLEIDAANPISALQKETVALKFKHAKERDEHRWRDTPAVGSRRIVLLKVVEVVELPAPEPKWEANWMCGNCGHCMDDHDSEGCTLEGKKDHCRCTIPARCCLPIEKLKNEH